jgi:hypothetical protein
MVNIIKQLTKDPFKESSRSISLQRIRIHVCTEATKTIDFSKTYQASYAKKSKGIQPIISSEGQPILSSNQE